MKRTLRRIFYKHYLTSICMMIWFGFSLIIDVSNQQFWGSFFVTIGLGLAWSEKDFILGCNERSVE